MGTTDVFAKHLATFNSTDLIHRKQQHRSAAAFIGD